MCPCTMLCLDKGTKGLVDLSLALNKTKENQSVFLQRIDVCESITLFSFCYAKKNLLFSIIFNNTVCWFSRLAVDIPGWAGLLGRRCPTPPVQSKPSPHSSPADFIISSAFQLFLKADM